MSVVETTLEIPAQYSTAVFGPFDEYVKKIEKTLKVTIVSRNSHIKVIGAKSDIDVLKYLQAFWSLQSEVMI